MRKILGVLIFLVALCCPGGALAQQPIRVNCGGPRYTDSRGQLWAADYGYNEGTASTISSAISGTSDPALYQDGRWNGNSSVPMTYTFLVVNGVYHVNLYFTETVKSEQFVGARVFTVKMQGNTAFDHLDIFAEAGANAALIKGADVTVSNGNLVIQFDSIVQNPKVHAIEILPGASRPSLMLNFKYPDGTPVAGTLAYSISSSLLSFKGSEPLVNGNAQCVLLANPSALGISAQFQANLSLTDSAGHVLWQMSLAVNPSQVDFGAIQSSALNVVVQRM
jgi:malectin (di-glucose binding ER protein)